MEGFSFKVQIYAACNAFGNKDWYRDARASFWRAWEQSPQKVFLIFHTHLLNSRVVFMRDCIRWTSLEIHVCRNSNILPALGQKFKPRVPNSEPSGRHASKVIFSFEVASFDKGTNPTPAPHDGWVGKKHGRVGVWTGPQSACLWNVGFLPGMDVSTVHRIGPQNWDGGQGSCIKVWFFIEASDLHRIFSNTI